MKRESKKIWLTKSSSLHRQGLALVILVLSTIAGWNCSSKTISPSVGPTSASIDDGFVESVWVDQWLLNKVKEGDINPAMRSLRNYTDFETYRNEKGEPSWRATVPDNSGVLSFKSGKWFDGEEALIEFLIKGKDTTAQYRFEARGYDEEGVGPIRTYQQVPRFRAEDGYIPNEWIYQLYYFPGSFSVIYTTDSDSFPMEASLTSTGEVIGMKGFSEYSLETGNSLPMFLMGERGEWARFVIEGTKSGFILYKVMNEDFDGPDLDIIQGPQLFKFIRSH